jgi:hypothetical protein
LEIFLSGEILIFALLVGSFLAIFAWLVHQKFQTSPAKRLFSETSTRNPTEKTQRDFISAELAKKLKNILGFSKDPLKAKELREKLIRAGHYGDRAMTIFIFFKVASPILLPLLTITRSELQSFRSMCLIDVRAHSFGILSAQSRSQPPD